VGAEGGEGDGEGEEREPEGGGFGMVDVLRHFLLRCERNF
jgi:hypothetical protein